LRRAILLFDPRFGYADRQFADAPITPTRSVTLIARAHRAY
jgi:hypothetical protein